MTIETVVFWFMLGLVFWLIASALICFLRAILSLFGEILNWIGDWLIDKFVD